MVIFFICYCIFRVYLVTGTKNPDISQEGTFRISKLIFVREHGVHAGPKDYFVVVVVVVVIRGSI
jgi:hypothetical protein